MRYLLFILVLFFFQCSQSSYNGVVDSNDQLNEIKSDNYAGTVEEQLAQMLRRESGVIVNQANGSYQVKIRGLANSFNSNTSPLYIIDGISIGHSFQSAAEAIAGNNIRSIKVLKGKDAAIYGTRGSAGVIEVKTKTPSFTQN